MTDALLDNNGHRKYLVAAERRAFIRRAQQRDKAVTDFCLTLALTGARLSEVLGLTYDRLDAASGTIVFRSLKQRQKIKYRAVPVPRSLLRRLQFAKLEGRIWPWCRTTAWKIVKSVMEEACIPPQYCKPKALRHAFAIEAGQNRVPLNIIQRWLGHSRIETTSIYAAAFGKEERDLARRIWPHLGAS